MQASDRQNAMHVALRCCLRSPWYFRGMIEAAKLLKNTLICKAWSAGHVGQPTVAMHIEDCIKRMCTEHLRLAKFTMC